MPIRGSSVSGLWSWTSGCVATQLMIAETSLPSKSGSSTSSVPPELHSPRGSQVTTLYPACRSAPTPMTSFGKSGSLIEFRLVSPGSAKPGPSRMVGAVCPSSSPTAGMKWT